MKVNAIKTPRISVGTTTLIQLLDANVRDIPSGSVLAITSKIISLCEGSVATAEVDKDSLIRDEADYYLPGAHSKYGIKFTITQGTLIPNAGIDESNSGDGYVLWPRDPQATANAIRAHLAHRFSRDRIGVVITDSTCKPLRRGVSGIGIAFSGFKPLRNYIGTPDLFGRPLAVSQADLVGGLAAAAVLVMGEGSESTPLALLEDVDFIDFVSRDPSAEELAPLQITVDEDLFAPFLEKVQWQPGGRSKRANEGGMP